ncbi:MAG: IS66 family transposase [Paracoccaceae bacterium]
MTETFENICDDLTVAHPAAGPTLSRLKLMFLDQRAESLHEKGKNSHLRNELLAARARIKALEASDVSENDAEKRISQLAEEIEQLQRKLAKSTKMTFGQKAVSKPTLAATEADDELAANKMLEVPEGAEASDASPQQNANPNEDEKPKNRTSKGRSKKNYGSGAELKICYIITEDKLCDCGCGGTFLNYEDSETLEYIPARYVRHIRKYANYWCRLKDKIVGTKFFKKLIDRTGMSPGFVAHIITMRYSWFLPWNRQSDRVLGRVGVKLDRSTLMRWSNRVATELLRPIYDILCDDIMQDSIRIFVDETTMPKLAPGTGKTKTSYIYSAHRDDSSFGRDLPPAVAYYARNTRAMYQIQDILKGCTAIVQHDGYPGYNCLGRPGTVFEDIVQAECWAHARRHFTDEWEFKKTPNAAIIVAMIGELYAVESRVRGRAPPVRVATRRAQSKPILTRITMALHEFRSQHLQKGGMGRAIEYVLRRWDALTRFVDNGFIDLDTNPVERMFKPTILARKNVMFIGSDEGADAWAIHSSLAETCRPNNINFEKYLLWVFDKIIAAKTTPDHASLLPWDAPTSCRHDVPQQVKQQSTKA